MEMIVDQLEEILNEGSLEIRGDGRAGSGLVMALQSLAAVAVQDSSFHVQEWPFFSPARKGAPTRGFIRLSKKPIETVSEIRHPHISLLMDEGVSKQIDFAEGVPAGGIFLLNTPHSPINAAKKLRLSGSVYTIDGDSLAQKFIKKPLGNVPIFALLIQIIPGFDLSGARKNLEEILMKRRLPAELIQANLDLFDASRDLARWQNCDFASQDEHRLKLFEGYGALNPGGQTPLRLSTTNKTSFFAAGGFLLEFSDPQNLCNGCGYCIINCPENIIQFQPDPETGVRVTGADVENYCKLCRECVAICPKQLFREVKAP